MVVSSPGGIMSDVAEVLRKLEKLPDVDPDAVLSEMVTSSLSHMPGARHAGITVASGDGTVETVSATDAYPALLDKIQLRHHEGPCLTAAWDHHVIRVDDIRQELRWPSYCRDVASETPIRSIVAFQLFRADNATGALNFHAEEPDVFDEHAVEVGLVLATHAALVWSMVRRDEQFRSALASRDIIGQAKGMIMERFDIDAVQAFELLKKLSQNSNTPLTAIAHQLISRKVPAADRG